MIRKFCRHKFYRRQYYQPKHVWSSKSHFKISMLSRIQNFSFCNFFPRSSICPSYLWFFSPKFSLFVVYRASDGRNKSRRTRQKPVCSSTPFLWNLRWLLMVALTRKFFFSFFGIFFLFQIWKFIGKPILGQGFHGIFQEDEKFWLNFPGGREAGLVWFFSDESHKIDLV